MISGGCLLTDRHSSPFSGPLKLCAEQGRSYVPTCTSVWPALFFGKLRTKYFPATWGNFSSTINPPTIDST